MQHSNLTLLSSRTHFLSFQTRMLWDSVKSLTKTFPALLPFLIHFTFCDEMADHQIKLAENELSFVNPCSLIPITFLALTCSETDYERYSHRLSLSCSTCNSLDALSDLRDTHSITPPPHPQLSVTFLYKNCL